MSEKRFIQSWNMHRGLHYLAIEDKQEKKMYCVEQSVGDVEKVADLLNKQEDTIITLKTRLEKINNGYGHLTHRKGLTANEWLIQSQEKELTKKNEQISNWIEQHSNDIAKISKQNKLIKNLKEENEQLKAKVKRLQDIATRTEAEKEEYADLYCKCENELIKNGRRCGGV